MNGLSTLWRRWLLNINVFIIHLLIYSDFSKVTCSVSHQKDDSIRHTTYLELDSSSFDAAINQYELVLINFYAPWCGHCQQIEKNLKVAAARLIVKQSKAKIAFLDATSEENTDLIERVGGIDGYPTLAIYKHGQRISDYNGGRKPKDIIDYLESKINPLVRRVDTLIELQGYLSHISQQGLFSDTGVLSVILGYFSEHQDVLLDEIPTFQLFQSSATKLDMSTFIYSHNPDVFQAYYTLPASSSSSSSSKKYADLLTTTTLLIFAGDSITHHHFEESSHNSKESSQNTEESSSPNAVLTGTIHFNAQNTTEIDLTKNILELSQPAIISYSKEVHAFLQYLPVKKHVLLFFQADDHHIPTSTTDSATMATAITTSAYLFKSIEEVASRYRGELIFLLIDSHQYALMQFFEIDATMLPQIVIADMSNSANMKRFVYDTFLDYHNESSILELIHNDNDDRSGDGSGGSHDNCSVGNGKKNMEGSCMNKGNSNRYKQSVKDAANNANNDDGHLYSDIIRAFSSSSSSSSSDEIINAVGSTAIPSTATTTQSRLSPATTTTTTATKPTARKALNGHNNLPPGINKNNNNNNNNYNNTPNSRRMKIQDKYSIVLLTLYFNSYLADMILPTLRSEALEPTTSFTTSSATTSTDDGSSNNNRNTNSANGMSPATTTASTTTAKSAIPIAVPSTATALLNSAQRGVVNKLIGATFWNIVIQDQSIDFFVFFVAPWCGHCKQLEPTIADVAHYYKSDRSMRIGRLDGTKNDINHDAVHVRSYPSFYLFLSTEKSQPIEYDGERSVKAMTQFIADERSKYRTRHRKHTI